MEESEPTSQSNLRRRNSIAATTLMMPVKLTLPSKPLHTSSLPLPSARGVASGHPMSLDLELISLTSSSLTYTSLKDLLPSPAVNSPTAAAGVGSSLSIRNRLVKQAAWAYLQPMSSSPSSSGTHFLRRIWLQFSVRNPFSACIRFITGAINRILTTIRVHLNR
ncbi:hypothetical protein K2173_012127 [Erythroxylum novogranatense]|uniref:Uncharacterized protein n=1 Tax=Erythroxylum novogranatense TaxID=1862640 RepID=A0AAV8SR80_9ROSI|nr:hypothetical protein K2173_012127 [Erythroxylum novogranatense]